MDVITRYTVVHTISNFIVNPIIKQNILSLIHYTNKNNFSNYLHAQNFMIYYTLECV